MSQVEALNHKLWQDFMEEFSSPVDKKTPPGWALFIYDANIVLEGAGDILIEQVLKFEFTANKNQAE